MRSIVIAWVYLTFACHGHGWRLQSLTEKMRSGLVDAKSLQSSEIDENTPRLQWSTAATHSSGKWSGKEVLNSMTPFARLLLVFNQANLGTTQRQHPDVSMLGSVRLRQRGLLSSVLVATSRRTSPGMAEAAGNGEKLMNLPAAKIAQIVRDDVVEGQFLATAALTREIYDESATFTDELNTFTLPSFIRGTPKLFVPDRSQVRLVGDVVADDTQVSFLFDEDLCFNIPFNPTVTVTGKVVLTRDPKTGLITKYREYWDQTLFEILGTAFNRPKN